MKIGIYAGTIPSPVFIENLANGLADKGNRVIIYGKAEKGYYQSHNFSIIQRRIPATKFGEMLYSIYTLVSLIIRQPHLYFTIVKIVRQNSKGWIQFLQRSCRVLPPLLDGLDIFHIQWAKTLVYYPEFIEKLKCPIILSLRGTHINVSPLADEKLASLYRKYFPKINGFHAVSKSIVKEAKKYGADLQKITVIYPAVNEQFLDFIPSVDNTENSEMIKIISVGRCHWIKGYTFALDAMVILKKEGVKFQYTIIAGGRDNENIHFQIHDLGLSKFVTFINELPHKKLIEKISISDLFLLPSIEEGISNAVLEAMALGVPIISTDCGGMVEVISNSKNGFLVPVRDPKSMARAIQKFQHFEKTDKMIVIKNARETIIHNHLLNDQVDKFKSFYSDIMLEI